jgi:hypothetical protein
MASNRFNDLQVQIEKALEKLKDARDHGERSLLLAELRKLLADLEREVQGGR